MTDQPTSRRGDEVPEEQEVELIDYLRVIWKRKGLIIGGALVAAIAALGVSLSLPKTYEVSRTLKIGHLPPLITEGRVQDKARLIEGREAVADRLTDHRALKALVEELQLSVSPSAVAHGMISVESRKRG
ncbi:MAG: Wzz/FepE/Etk N-terminal domain-containing protein, partial [Acidobacteriota bacterium]